MFSFVSNHEVNCLSFWTGMAASILDISPDHPAACDCEQRLPTAAGWLSQHRHHSHHVTRLTRHSVCAASGHVTRLLGCSVCSLGGGSHTAQPLQKSRDSSQTPDTWAEKYESFERINSIRKTNENFRSFYVSNLSVRNFRFFLLMYPGSKTHHSCHTGAGECSADSPSCDLRGGANHDAENLWVVHVKTFRWVGIT